MYLNVCVCHEFCAARNGKKGKVICVRNKDKPWFDDQCSTRPIADLELGPPANLKTYVQMFKFKCEYFTIVTYSTLVFIFTNSTNYM